MKWLETSVTVDCEAAEAVAEILSRYAPRGVAIEAGPDGGRASPVTVRAYAPADDSEELRCNKRRIEEALWHLGQIWPIPAPTFQPVDEEDWAEAWKAQLSVLHIGEHIVIRPSWLEHKKKRDDIIIQLDPGMAFGTGLHPTTQLCLETLESLVQPGMDVLDMGTGTGILAIAAAKLGATHVTAVDSDRVAIKIARENVALNTVPEAVEVRCGSLEDVGGSYDLVAVNILARVIIEMMHQGLGTRVKSGGKIIAAGIILDQESDVKSAMEQEGFAVVDRRRRDDWVCLVASSPEGNRA
jgi:ribosomal protein L11 methyltransferase